MPPAIPTQRTPEEEMARNLRLMMAHVGLKDIPLSELGGNYPDLNAALGNNSDAALSNNSDTSPDNFQGKATTGKAAQRRVPARIKQPPEQPLHPHPNPNPNPKDEQLTHHADRREDALSYETPDTPPALPPVYEQDIDPIERACRLQLMMWQGDYTVTGLARELGRSRAYVRNHLRLLRLPAEIQDHVKAGRLSEGHARAIAKMRDPQAMARLIIARQLSVRQAEIIARRLRYIGPDGQLLRATAIPNTAFTENLIEAAIGHKVQIKDRAGRGQICIDYQSPEEAQQIVERLTRTFEGIGAQDV